MKNDRNAHASFFIAVVILCLVLSSCVPKPTPVISQTPTREPGVTPTIAPPSIPTRIPTATPIPLPRLSLVPGEYYFRLGDQPAMIFSRNFLGPILSRTGTDLKTALGWAHQAGTRLIRVHLTGWWGIPWMNHDGTVNETWAQNWDWFFDQTRAEGIYVLPVFGVCADWNSQGWQFNPLNQANGGYLTDPTELFQPGSITQEKWMAWIQSLVQRWQGRDNILAWEIFSEVNIAVGTPYTPNYTGVSEPAGVDFIERAAEIIRAVDSHHRPTTASLADVDEWPTFLRSDAIDFINIHPYPYPPQLDTFIIQKTHAYLATYHKPVLIGESGLSGAAPDTAVGNITIAEKAPIGISHAIWAGVISGAMNGRGLFWEDSYALAVTGLDFSFLEKYARAESATAAFVESVDFSGFRPLTDHPSAGVTGAAIGNEDMLLGWYRDAASEPINWTVQTISAGQTVTITVPGTAPNWKVDFYDTKTGTTILSSASVLRHGSTVTVTLPEFKDDIAFKMMPGAETATISPGATDRTNALAGTETATVTPGATQSTNALAGIWNGTISNLAGTFSTPIKLSIQSNCAPGRICGTYSTPQLPCSGDLFLNEITAAQFIFIEQNSSGAAFCKPGGYEYLQLLEDGTLSYRYSFQSTGDSSTGILHRP